MKKLTFNEKQAILYNTLDNNDVWYPFFWENAGGKEIALNHLYSLKSEKKIKEWIYTLI